MTRAEFILSTPALMTSLRCLALEQAKPQTFFFEDDGIVPNSRYPLLLYRKAIKERNEKGAAFLEKVFATNNWSNSWRNGIFTFQHYHSIAHEVLGLYSGEALVLLGGEKGKSVTLAAGDVVVIPAGIGHKNLGDHKLGVVGAYPEGMDVDIMRCLPGERPGVDENIARVPKPSSDPLGTNDIQTLWTR